MWINVVRPEDSAAFLREQVDAAVRQHSAV
jgi:hypothetical protein